MLSAKPLISGSKKRGTRQTTEPRLSSLLPRTLEESTFFPHLPLNAVFLAKHFLCYQSHKNNCEHFLIDSTITSFRLLVVSEGVKQYQLDKQVNITSQI